MSAWSFGVIVFINPRYIPHPTRLNYNADMRS